MEYAQCVKAFISSQNKKGLAQSSISTRVGILKSFFKYNDLPLGFIPAIKPIMSYHNRDITHEEIKLILDSSRPRERAFFAIMAQSGLRPLTICKLKYENIKEDWEKNRIPCKIEIPQEIAKGKYHSYFTFIGDEAVKHLKSYLLVRPKIFDEEYLFLKEGTKEQANPKSISRIFALTVKKLHVKGLMELKQKKENKPHDVRLYNLRKWFRKFANQVGFEYVQFWMGHTVNAGQDDHYRPRDVEFHRELYSEKAMPHLRLETATPTENDRAIITLEQENRELKNKIENLETMMKKMYHKVFDHEIEQEYVDKLIDENREHFECEHQQIIDYEEMQRKEEEYLANHPEERKRRKQEEDLIKDYVQQLEEHSADIEDVIKQGEEESIRSDERRKIFENFKELLKKTEKIRK
jgi:integrase